MLTTAQRMLFCLLDLVAKQYIYTRYYISAEALHLMQILCSCSACNWDDHALFPNFNRARDDDAMLRRRVLTAFIRASERSILKGRKNKML